MAMFCIELGEYKRERMRLLRKYGLSGFYLYRSPLRDHSTPVPGLSKAIDRTLNDIA